MYNFLQILASKYPIWFKRDIYIFGESYGGHYVPAIAYKIISENQSSGVTGTFYIPLKGIGLGDPLCDVYYQSQYYEQAAYNFGLINLDQSSQISELQSSIYYDLKMGNYSGANYNQNLLLSQLTNFSGGASLYNVREYSNPDMGNYEGWLNLPETKSLLNVPNNIEWQSCNDEIFDA